MRQKNYTKNRIVTYNIIINLYTSEFIELIYVSFNNKGTYLLKL